MGTDRQDTATSRSRWLIVVPEIIKPDRAAGDRRLMEILQLLSKSCDLDLIVTNSGRPAEQHYKDGLTNAAIRLLGFGVRAGVQAILAHKYDAVLFEFYHTAQTLLRVIREVQPRALVVVDTVDLHFLREREAVKLGVLAEDTATNTERQELSVYSKADIVIAISEREQEVLYEHGVRSVIVIPIIVEITLREERQRDPELLFVGGFNHAPNREAVNWFYRHVWADIKRRVPDARWIIAGSNTPPDIAALDGDNGIEVAGFVPSTMPLLNSAQVSIAPLTFGAGMKGKISEALAAGVPVVTTRWGAQGLEEGTDDAFLVADQPAEFADAVVRLLNDSTQRSSLSISGQRLANRLCSPAAASPAIEELVNRSVNAASESSLPRRALSFAIMLSSTVMSKVRR